MTDMLLLIIELKRVDIGVFLGKTLAQLILRLPLMVLDAIDQATSDGHFWNSVFLH